MFAYQYVNVSCTETRLPPKRSNPNKLQTTIGWQYIIHRWRGRQHLKIGNIWGEKQPAKAFKMKLAKTEKRGRKEVGTKEVRLDRMAQEARYSRRRGWGEKRQSKKTVNDWPFDGSLCTVSSLSGRGKQVSRCWSRSYRTRWQTMTGISHGGGPPLFQLTGRLETPNHPPPHHPPPPLIFNDRATTDEGPTTWAAENDSTYRWTCPSTMHTIYIWTCPRSMYCTCRWICPWTMYSTYIWTCPLPHADEHVPGQCILPTDEHVTEQCIASIDDYALDNVFHIQMNMSLNNAFHVQMNISLDNVFHLQMDMSPDNANEHASGQCRCTFLRTRQR